MKEKVAEFYKGDFIYKRPKLVLSEKNIELSVCAGSVYKGFFTISAYKDTIVKGILEPSCPLLRLNTKVFFSEMTRVDFEFDGTHLEVNDTLNEHIKVISDCGEYIININVKIVRPYFNSKMGKIMDLTRFTYLARYNWSQATEIFISREFPSYILSNDENYAFIRKQLLKSKSVNHALEEFLVATQQKHSIKLSINQNKLLYDMVNMGNESIADKILITRETWGYIDIDISTDAPFLLLEKNYINSDSLIGNSYFLEFIISPSKMHSGNNYGRIYIKTTYETLIIEVKAIAGRKVQSKSEEKIGHNIKLKTHKVHLTKLYLDYRFNNISREEYVSSVKQVLYKMKILSSKIPGYSVSDYYNLFDIESSILNNEEEKNGKLLDEIEGKTFKWENEKPNLYFAYMAIKDLYTGDNESNKKSILLEISNHFSKGMKSPYLYYEALKIFNENPSFLRSLNQFEVQIINFGVKNNQISKELAFQFVYLASKTKSYNKLIFNALASIYKQVESIEVLNAICSLLIKGNKRANKYFPWYNLGVLVNLRITELYEYFMHSIDEEIEQRLPQNLLYYFSYSNTLNVQKKSYLYAYVIKHKDETPEVYKTYLINIEKFAYEQVKAGCINSNLAIIYKDIFANKKSLKDQRKFLWNVVFRYDIECYNPNIKGVLVAHKEINKETYTPLNKGYAQVDLYNDEAEIFFIDNKDNLYYSDIDHRMNYIIDLPESEILQLEINEENYGSILYTTYKALDNKVYDKKSLEARQKILDLPGISREFYNKNLLSLIYYYSRSNTELLDEYLELIDYMPGHLKDKHTFIELLIDKKFYMGALNEIKKFGIDKIDIEKIYDLCTGIIRERYEDGKDDWILFLSYYCFSNDRYNDYILNYLTKHYIGKTSKLYKIWEVALSYNINTKELEAKILTQAIFTESREFDSLRVFKNLTRNGIKSVLSKAYVSFQAYEYLVRDYPIDEGFFRSMELLVKTEENNYCILALLKYYSIKEWLDEGQIKFIHRFLDGFIKKGIVLPFFKNFKDHILMPYDFVHKTFVEIKSQIGDKVTIRYKYIADDESQDESYTTEVMDHSFSGIFIKTFLMFYGEKLEYSITVEGSDGDSFTKEEKTIELGQDIEMSEDNLYEQINLMKLAMDTEDWESFIDTYNNISKTDYVINKVFKPM